MESRISPECLRRISPKIPSGIAAEIIPQVPPETPRRILSGILLSFFQKLLYEFIRELFVNILFCRKFLRRLLKVFLQPILQEFFKRFLHTFLQVYFREFLKSFFYKFFWILFRKILKISNRKSSNNVLQKKFSKNSFKIYPRMPPRIAHGFFFSKDLRNFTKDFSTPTSGISARLPWGAVPYVIFRKFCIIHSYQNSFKDLVGIMVDVSFRNSSNDSTKNKKKTQKY